MVGCMEVLLGKIYGVFIQTGEQTHLLGMIMRIMLVCIFKVLSKTGRFSHLPLILLL